MTSLARLAIQREYFLKKACVACSVLTDITNYEDCNTTTTLPESNTCNLNLHIQHACLRYIQQGSGEDRTSLKNTTLPQSVTL